jgi:hypothetical protein
MSSLSLTLYPVCRLTPVSLPLPPRSLSPSPSPSTLVYSHSTLYPGVISACLLGALPLAVAIFPQVVSIPASSLEPQFRTYVSPTTKQPITTYYFNKGV